jgi:uncharacterized protein YecE (DUF72 family)
MAIHAGIGGWTFEGWRGGTFYPDNLKQADEFHYASRAVQAIEVNGTFYRLQKPESFRKWRQTAPDGFLFALKGSRYVSNRKNLAEAGEGVAHFCGQGIAELGDMLGPIVWQFAKTKRFDPEEIASFLELLPGEVDGLSLRHAIEVGHESFACAQFVDLMRNAGAAIVWSEEEDRTQIADRTADFAYCRLQRLQMDCKTGYDAKDLDRLVRLCRAWEAGGAPKGLPYAGKRSDSEGSKGGDVFAFFINGAKERARAAAVAFAEMLGDNL